MVAMSHPDDVARLREIKRLLERIQSLPRLAGLPACELTTGKPPPPLRDDLTGALLREPADDGLATMQRAGPPGGHLGASAGPPHPSGGDPDLATERRREVVGAELLDDDPLPASFDPANYDTSQRDGERSDYWASDLTPDRAAADWPSGYTGAAGSGALVAVRPKPAGGFAFSPWMFVLATAVNTVVAAVLAIVITLGVARRDTAAIDTDKGAAAAKAEAKAEPAVPRPLELRPVGSAKEPMRLEAMKPALLPFQVRPEEAMDESYILVLTGLPPNATISGALRMGTDSWHLPPGALQKLEIVVPEWSATVIEVGVELRRTNGAVAAQSKLWLAVPPPPTPKGASLDEAALRELVHSGDKLLSRGDVAAARAVYERAAAMGSAQAALAMGTTFDPRRLWSLGVFGMVGNKDRARHWYQRADELGHPDAKARIVALQ